MTKKHTLLAASATLMIGITAYANRDSFTQPPIQISHRLHAFAGRFANNPGTVPLLFEFNRKLALTSIEVIPLSELETNKHPRPLWHLVSDSKSVPTRGFLYGMNVQGMRPSVPGSSAGPLDLNVKYRLVIRAGSVEARHDFVLEMPSP